MNKAERERDTQDILSSKMLLVKTTEERAMSKRKRSCDQTQQHLTTNKDLGESERICEKKETLPR